MVLLQQAVAYIFRKRTRNFILFLILFLILSCLYFCFSLMQVGGGMEAQIRKSSGASFDLVSKERGSAFSWKEGAKISHLSDVISTIPQYVSPVRLIDKKVVTGKQTVERDDLDNEANQALATFTKETGQSVDFRSGAFQLIKGKHISAKGQIMIHESLARKNKLSVGDKLTLSNFQLTESGAREMTFDIVGIFTGKKEETFTGMSSDLSENQVFLHYEDASQLLNLTDKLVTKLSFGIKNPDRIDQVIKQVKQLDIDWYRLRLDEDRKAFDSLKESSQALQEIVRTMMISLIVTGAGILSFLMALWTRERNHEIGILLAIGKSKGRIFAQFLMEILLVSLMSLLPALAIGRLLSRLFLQEFIGQQGQQQ
ncbi:MAG: ABC transporter permease, partial [Streptococcus sp.]